MRVANSRIRQKPGVDLRYPVPGQAGGTLIRHVIQALRRHGSIKLPLDSHILIAVSGGVDSMALAKLLVKYGRRVADFRKIRLLHINHGWRGVESDQDEKLVRNVAQRWGVPISVFRIKDQLKSQAARGRSPEDFARDARKRIYETVSRRYASEGKQAFVLTAHHADDVAETLIWRFFTGSLSTHGGGIAFRHGPELRPLLGIRKRDLIAFLREEGEGWAEDRTNHEGVLLRSRMRMELIPVIESVFPLAIQQVARQGLRALVEISRGTLEADEQVGPAVLFSAAGLKVRKAHWEWLRDLNEQRSAKAMPQQPIQLSLPGGWTLRAEKASRVSERWILEKSSQEQAQTKSLRRARRTVSVKAR